MRTKLLATVAAVALIGCSGMAVAQQQDEHGGAAKPGASEQHPMAPGGAAQHAQPGGSAQKQMPEKGAPKGMSQAEQPGKAGVKPEEHAQTPAGSKPEGSAQTEQRGGQNADCGECRFAHVISSRSDR